MIRKAFSEQRVNDEVLRLRLFQQSMALKTILMHFKHKIKGGGAAKEGQNKNIRGWVPEIGGHPAPLCCFLRSTVYNTYF